MPFHWPSAHYRVTLPPNLPSNSPDKRYQAQPGSQSVVARLGIKTRLPDLQQAHAALIPLTSARFIFLQPGQIEFTSRQGGARPSFFRLIGRYIRLHSLLIVRVLAL